MWGFHADPRTTPVFSGVTAMDPSLLVIPGLSSLPPSKYFHFRVWFHSVRLGSACPFSMSPQHGPLCHKLTSVKPLKWEKEGNHAPGGRGGLCRGQEAKASKQGLQLRQALKGGSRFGCRR